MTACGAGLNVQYTRSVSGVSETCSASRGAFSGVLFVFMVWILWFVDLDAATGFLCIRKGQHSDFPAAAMIVDATVKERVSGVDGGSSQQ